MRRLIPLSVCLILYNVASAQLPQNAFSFNCTKDTMLACGQSCLNLRTTVPVIRAVSNQYSVRKAACFRPNVSPATPAISLEGRDDVYSPVITLPFNFPFYNILYSQLVVSTNGMISFDITNAQQGAQWTILNGEGSLPTDAYDRAIIMGVYHDIDIQFPNTSPDKQIKYEVTGTAPHRKWVLSFYKVPCFQNTCWSKINNTYQITLYEGLGLVEVHVFGREICTTWNNGNAMIGMQNYEQDNGIMAPGRSAWTTPPWGGLNMNEAWRFAPNAGPSLLKSVELYKPTGELVAMGDTSNDGNGNYNVSFNNICPDADTSTYIVKSSYYHFEYPLQFPAADSIIYATDTINVIKEPVARPLISVVFACPGQGNGSIIVNSPIGPEFEYSLDSGIMYQSSRVFPNLYAGQYIVAARDFTTGCVTYSYPIILGEGYQTYTQIKYQRKIYCSTDTISPAPVISGITNGRFTAAPPLFIDSISGLINIASSDTGFYTITYNVQTLDSCANSFATTTLRIVDTSQFAWTGAVNNNWENPANWSCNNLPGNTSNVIIYSGTVIINSNVTINKLTILPGANLTVSPGYNLTVLNPGL